MTKKGYVNFLEVISGNAAKLTSSGCETQQLYQRHIYSFLRKSINQMDCMLFWKDTDSIYMGSNMLAQEILMGMKDKFELVGASDLDVAKKTKWSLNLIEEFRNVDMQVCNSQQSLTCEETYIRSDNSKATTLLTTKVPIWGNNQEIIGLFGVSTEINQLKFSKQNAPNQCKRIMTSSIKSICGIAQILQAQQLAFAQSMYADNIIESSDQLARVISEMFNLHTLEEKQKCENYYRQRLSNRYYLKGNGEETYLTRRELQCLAHLFFGRSAKETAAILNVSVKTVESYLDI